MCVSNDFNAVSCDSTARVVTDSDCLRITILAFISVGCCLTCWWTENLACLFQRLSIISLPNLTRNSERWPSQGVRNTITLGWAVHGEVTVSQIYSNKQILSEMPMEMVGTATTPAEAHLFYINKNSETLAPDKAEGFHRMEMQLQYLSQHGCLYLRTAVSFLVKRTSKADEDAWKKLQRVIRYLQGMQTLPLRLSADGWVDASYAVHMDMKRHTGATMRAPFTAMPVHRNWWPWVQPRLNSLVSLTFYPGNLDMELPWGAICEYIWICVVSGQYEYNAYGE